MRGRRIPDTHFIRGIARMGASLGVALAVMVMVALALGHVRAGRPESTRLLFAAVPFDDIGGAPRCSTPYRRPMVRLRAANRPESAAFRWRGEPYSSRSSARSACSKPPIEPRGTPLVACARLRRRFTPRANYPNRAHGSKRLGLELYHCHELPSERGQPVG